MKQISIQKLNDIFKSKMVNYQYLANSDKNNEHYYQGQLNAIQDMQNSVFETLGVISLNEFIEKMLLIDNHYKKSIYNDEDFNIDDFELVKIKNGFQLVDDRLSLLFVIDNDAKVTFTSPYFNIYQKLYVQRNAHLIRPIFLTSLNDSEFNEINSI